MRLVGVAIANARFFAAVFIVFDLIQRYSLPLTGCIAGENKEVIPCVLRAVLPVFFMSLSFHQSIVSAMLHVLFHRPITRANTSYVIL